MKAISALYAPLIKRILSVESEIMVTSGGFDALNTIFMTLLNQDDEVILIEPYFYAYDTLIRMAGGHPVPFALTFDRKRGGPTSNSSCDVWSLDLNRLRKTFTKNTKLLIWNNPHNPTGKVFDRCTVEAVVQMCHEANVIVVSDDVYEFSVFDSKELARVASVDRRWDNCLTIGSAGKTFGFVFHFHHQVRCAVTVSRFITSFVFPNRVTGWKISWIYGAGHLISLVARYHRHSMHTAATPLQEAIAILLEACVRTDYLDNQAKLQQSKRNTLVDHFNRAGLAVIMPDGGNFITVDFSAWTMLHDKPSGDDESRRKFGQKDHLLMIRFAEKTCVLGMPFSLFGQPHSAINMPNHLLRFCFVKSDKTLANAGQALANLS